MFAWEELILLLQNVTLQVNKDDSWLWNLETFQVYSFSGAYNLTTAQHQTPYLVAASAIWNKDVPLKVGLYAWRLFRDRLPTKDNLLRGSVITTDLRLCVAGCGYEESVAHLF